MNQLKREELEEIREVMENGLNLVPNLDRFDKMNMRKRIRSELEGIGEIAFPSTEGILCRLEEKLSDVMNQLPYGQLEELKKLLAVQTARFRSMGAMKKGPA